MGQPGRGPIDRHRLLADHAGAHLCTDRRRDLARRVQPGRADLPGFVHNPYKYVCRSEVFVLSSLYEGFPNSLLEAMVVGTPVVATDCQSGPREILEDGRYGALVRLGDVDEMAQAILAALDDRLAKPSLTHLRDLYSIDHIARRYEQIL